jgi:hypothetical protein
MPEPIPQQDGRLEHPTVHYEPSDANFNWILFILLVALALAALILYLIAVFFFNYAGYEANIKKSNFPLAPSPSTALPPSPRLEPIDRLEDIQKSKVFERQAGEESTLNTLGPTEDRGYVHISIDRAMQLLEGKLPVRKEPPAGQRRRAGGLLDWGQPNSGRIFRHGRSR